jgi:hypothetical protein
VWYITSAGAGAQIYRLNRFREAQPGDVFYGQAPLEGSPVAADKYWLHEANGRDRTFNSPLHYLVAVDVDGRQVTARTVTSRGQELDSLALTPGTSTSREVSAHTATRHRDR